MSLCISVSRHTHLVGKDSSPWIPLSSACLAICTEVQLEATPSISSDSSQGETHSFFLKIRISMRWGIGLDNILQVVRYWWEYRKTAFYFYIQPESPMLQLLSLSQCALLWRDCLHPHCLPTGSSLEWTIPGPQSPFMGQEFQSWPSWSLSQIAWMFTFKNQYIIIREKKILICLSMFLFSHREVVPCGPYWKILSGDYILNPSTQTSKSKATKGQKHSVNTLNCTSLALLPITARLSLEARSCHGT